MTSTPTKPAPNLWLNVKNLYASGYSDVEVMAELGITKEKFFDLYQTNTQFRGFIDMGRVLSEAWWHKQIRTSVKDRDIQTALVKMVMSNRFGWTDKVRNENADVPVENLSMDDLITKVNSYMEEFARVHGHKPALAQAFENVQH